MRWTETEDKILETLWHYATSVEIAAVLGLLGYKRGSSAIRNRAIRLNLAETGYQGETLEERVQENLSPEEAKIVLSVLGPECGEDEEVTSQLLQPVASSSDKAAYTKQSRSIYNELLTFLDQLAVTDKRVSIPLPAKSKGAESLVVVLSDLHFGKLIKNRRGQDLYNVQIATERMQALTEQIAKLGAHIEASSIIDEVVIVLAGDIVDNEGIYETQAFHLDATLLGQIQAATESLWSLITTLATQYPQVRVITCRGNHGRTGGAESSNWDNIVYYILSVLVKTTGLPVSVSTSLDEYNTFFVKGYKGLIRHEIPKPDGTPTASAKLGGWYARHHYDFLISGHYHQVRLGYYHGKPLFRNGALTGGDDLAERMGVDDDPKQLLFGVSEKHVPTFLYPLEF